MRPQPFFKTVSDALKSHVFHAAPFSETLFLNYCRSLGELDPNDAGHGTEVFQLVMNQNYLWDTIFKPPLEKAIHTRQIFTATLSQDFFNHMRCELDLLDSKIPPDIRIAFPSMLDVVVDFARSYLEFISQNIPMLQIGEGEIKQYLLPARTLESHPQLTQAMTNFEDTMYTLRHTGIQNRLDQRTQVHERSTQERTQVTETLVKQCLRAIDTIRRSQHYKIDPDLTLSSCLKPERSQVDFTLYDFDNHLLERLLQDLHLMSRKDPDFYPALSGEMFKNNSLGTCRRVFLAGEGDQVVGFDTSKRNHAVAKHSAAIEKKTQGSLSEGELQKFRNFLSLFDEHLTEKNQNKASDSPPSNPGVRLGPTPRTPAQLEMAIPPTQVEHSPETLCVKNSLPVLSKILLRQKRTELNIAIKPFVSLGLESLKLDQRALSLTFFPKIIARSENLTLLGMLRQEFLMNGSLHAFQGTRLCILVTDRIKMLEAIETQTLALQQRKAIFSGVMKQLLLTVQNNTPTPQPPSKVHDSESHLPSPPKPSRKERLAATKTNAQDPAEHSPLFYLFWTTVILSLLATGLGWAFFLVPTTARPPLAPPTIDTQEIDLMDIQSKIYKPLGPATHDEINKLNLILARYGEPVIPDHCANSEEPYDQFLIRDGYLSVLALGETGKHFEVAKAKGKTLDPSCHTTPLGKACQHSFTRG